MTTTVGGIFSRDVSPAEWLHVANPHDATMIIQVFVEGAGVIDVAELRDAVARTGTVCPGSRLVRHGRRWIDGGAAPEVRVVAGAGADPITLAGDQRLLRGDDGVPATEVVLITGERPTLIFRAAHAVMDGKGVQIWALEVFRALRGLPGRPAIDPVTVPDLLRRSTFPKGPRDAPRMPAMLTRPADDRSRATAAVRRSVDGHHSALVAKIAVALRGLCGGGRMTFFVPVDLRRHAPDARLTANLFGALDLAVDASTSWQQAHQVILAGMRDNAELATLPSPRLGAQMLRTPLAVHRTILRQLDTRLAKRGQSLCSFALTHLGRVELDDFGTDDFRAVAVYSAPRRGLLVPPTMTMLEIDRRTELVLAVDDDPQVVARANELMDGVVAALSPAASRLRTGGPGPANPPDTLVSMFADRVAAAPGAIALTAGDTDLSYADLDRRAGAVAAALAGRGVTRGDVVGLLAERDIPAVVGLLGILRAGAAFLPLDTHHPDARLAGLLADAGVRVCLADGLHAGRAAYPPECATVVLDDLPPQAPDGAPALPEVAPDDLATVIYTSGSTGRPKGVEVEHRNLVNYARWAIRMHEVDQTSCFALFSSMAYLLPYTAILNPLFAGGRIVLVTEEPNHVTLRRLLSGGLGVNSIKITPSHMELISRLKVPATGIRLVVFGGERLTGAMAVKARQTFGPDCAIFNGNGITEMSGACAMHRVDTEADAAAASVPIGRPVDHTEIVLLDHQGAQVPPGEVGEMHVAGAQLARGYRNRPDLTGERFVRLADGTRVYRTGDLARVLPSGDLEHVGRADDQVKVLGHRVEPAEVAAVLDRHPAVREALVMPRSRPGQSANTLCAYVSTTAAVTPSELTAYVAAHLPRQLVPSIVMILPELPRNANGKIDKVGLPDPYLAAGSDAGVAPVVPEDELAAAVAKIWAETLGVDVDEVARHGDFNVLGGDSISFLAMIAAVSRTLLADTDEQRFTDALADLIAEPTLGAVTTLVRGLSLRRLDAA